MTISVIIVIIIIIVIIGSILILVGIVAATMDGSCKTYNVSAAILLIIPTRGRKAPVEDGRWSAALLALEDMIQVP